MSGMGPVDPFRSRRDYHFAHYRGPRRFRFFPRLFWFGLGAGAFAMWVKHKEKNERMLQDGTGGAHSYAGRLGCGSRHNHQRAQEWSAASPHPLAPSTTAEVPTSTPAQAPIPMPIIRGNEPAPPSTQAHTHEWRAESIREVGKHASDTVAEMSESALDSLMANIQALKAKIAETREEREKEKLYLDQRIPAENSGRQDRNDSRRLV
ncbi:hypothetical protein DFH11DRAFT_1729756 [Phellopilus nigrolimitatus]|nr:hypothetical protein DFH11DRAFT_1729756 [Phellopilus nigrolimitatus]